MIKLGNNDITLKIGSADVSAAYLGSVLVYNPVPPEPKWIATYAGGTTSSAECDVSSAITQNEIVMTNLVSVEIGDCVTSIGDDAFGFCLSLSSITIPDSVTNIGNQAFAYCSSLTSVTIGSGVTTIGNSAFYNDSSITSLNIPDSVTSIGYDAFNGCIRLSSIVMPSGVTSIGEQAFYGCYGVSSFTCLATTPPTLGNYAFEDTNNCPIYVPAASVSAYQTAWSTYASRIQAIPTPSPQWVTFNSGDDISGLQAYGVKGVAVDLSNTFGSIYENIYFELSRNIVNAFIGDYFNPCYTDAYGINDNVEIVFSNVGCSDYYTIPSSMTAGGTIQLYIYQ